MCNMKLLVSLITIIFVSSFASANQPSTQFLKMGSLQVHYGVFSQVNEVIGDVLFLHGYGDSFLNHLALFKQLNESGLRVIGFDYPSHGKTQGMYWNDLDFHSFKSLTEIAEAVLNETSSTTSRPLFIIGWSTGGLHAIRIAQVPRFRKLFPSLSGLVLYAPGVAVKKCVGNSFCHITNETLNHDPLLRSRQIEPRSPLYRIDFAAKLIFNATRSWYQGIPEHVPTLVFVGGEKDKYVKTKDIKSWVQLQRNQFSADINAIQCPQAFHELDNELPKYGGKFVREQSIAFVRSIVFKKTMLQLPLEGLCREF